MKDDLVAPDGYYWKTGVYNDKEFGWTGFAELYTNGRPTKSRWWNNYFVGAPAYSAHKVHYLRRPDELVRSAKESCLEQYNEDIRRADRDAEFRNYGRRNG
jgi:cation diffusion facilitator CzcD-associated flavoprotein CzcO